MMRLSEAIDELGLATWADGGSSRTVGDYPEKLRHMLSFLGNVPVEEITTSDLRRYVADLRNRSTVYADHPTQPERKGSLSPFTVQSRVRVLKRLFNFLVEEGVLKENPAQRIKIPNLEPDELKAISLDDFQALLETTEGDDPIDIRDQAVILFLLDTGCRVGGLCGLEVDDVDLEKQRARVKEKGKKRRTVFFESRTAQALTAWLEVRPQGESDCLFTSFGGKSDKLTTRGVSHMLIRRGKRAGCKGPVNPHAFRHAFAINYLMNGGDLGTLSKLMGHSGVSVTIQYYGRFALGDLQEKHRRHSPIARLGGGENDN